MHNHDQDGPPCSHMEKLLQEAADGSITGLKKIYTLAHAARCHRCGTFLERMKLTISALQSQKQEVPQDAMERLKAKHLKSGEDS